MILIIAISLGIGFVIGFFVTYVPLSSKIEELKNKIEKQKSELNGRYLIGRH